jgi:hypothetical protein
MNSRLWYSQLDAYDAVRRMGLLLLEWAGAAPSAERLFILDFYLATPPLLHQATLPLAVRDAFRQLRVPKPEASFIALPSAPLLFHKMAEVQKAALQTMYAKGLLRTEAAAAGTIAHSESGRELFAKTLSSLTDEEEISFARFLLTHLAHVDDGEIGELRRRTGLRRLIQ